MMPGIMAMVGIVGGALLLAAGLVTSTWWLILLGFVVMPTAFVFPLVRAGKSASPEQPSGQAAPEKRGPEPASGPEGAGAPDESAGQREPDATSETSSEAS